MFGNLFDKLICAASTRSIASGSNMKININIIGIPNKFDISVTPRVSFLHNDRNLLIQHFSSKNIDPHIIPNTGKK